MTEETGYIEEPWLKAEELLSENDRAGMLHFFDSLHATEIARVLSRLDEEKRVGVFSLLEAEDSADILDQLSDVQAVELIEDLPAETAAMILNEIPSDTQADLLGELSASEANDIIERMEFEEAEDVRMLLQYETDTAGGIMITEYLAFTEDMLIRDIIRNLQEYRDEYAEYDIQYAFIANKAGILTGVVPFRELLFASPEWKAKEIMIHKPLSVKLSTPLSELVNFFDEHAFYGVPVVNEAGLLTGVVQRSAVHEMEEKEANRNFLNVSGLIGEEEIRTMPLYRRSSRRLAWLSINIVLNIIAASVIALYQETLAAVIALAVFLPIISDMSGCSGNQAVAVSIRELVMGMIKPADFVRVFFKESTVGLINGFVLGLLIASVAYFWKGNIYLGLVVGGAMMANTLLSVILGGIIPLVLKRFKLDPALASGPILTTVTDMFGFFFVLSMATALMPYIVT